MTGFGGPWTIDKLNILKGYLNAYTTALKDRPFRLFYVDAFAGEGSLGSGLEYTDADYGDFSGMVQGSPVIAPEVDDKPFDHLVFVENNLQRSQSLRQLATECSNRNRNIEVINDDANLALPRFCAHMGPNDRAVVFLDPFATEVDWETVRKIANTQKIDCWIWFPIMAISRILPTRSMPPPPLAAHLDRIFGEREYWQDFYQESPQQLLPMFADQPLLERESGSNLIANRYRERLQTIFASVAPTRRTFRNSRQAPLFELFFAAGNPNGAPIAVRIAEHLLQNL